MRRDARARSACVRLDADLGSLVYVATCGSSVRSILFPVDTRRCLGSVTGDDWRWVSTGRDSVEPFRRNDPFRARLADDRRWTPRPLCVVWIFRLPRRSATLVCVDDAEERRWVPRPRIAAVLFFRPLGSSALRSRVLRARGSVRTAWRWNMAVRPMTRAIPRNLTLAVLDLECLPFTGGEARPCDECRRALDEKSIAAIDG